MATLLISSSSGTTESGRRGLGQPWRRRWQENVVFPGEEHRAGGFVVALFFFLLTGTPPLAVVCSRARAVDSSKQRSFSLPDACLWTSQGYYRRLGSRRCWLRTAGLCIAVLLSSITKFFPSVAITYKRTLSHHPYPGNPSSSSRRCENRRQGLVVECVGGGSWSIEVI